MKLIPPTGLVTVLTLLLSGCQTPPSSQVSCTPQSTTIRTQTVNMQTRLLQKNGAINTRAFRLPPPVTANSQRITIKWDGDAVELLAQLAHRRGANFVYTGTRLPLPVDVNVTNMTFENLLSLLREQIGWRARLTQDGSELRLYFSVPERGGRLT